MSQTWVGLLRRAENRARTSERLPRADVRGAESFRTRTVYSNERSLGRRLKLSQRLSTQNYNCRPEL
eukprot:4630917-Pleurochrysis_carterae.AAC.1